MSVLPAAFYDRPVVEVAHDLVGCTVTHGGCAGVIVETEAYHESEPACHAHVGLTGRTHILFGPPARAYVYRSYGIHALFNAVTEAEGVGAAVLIRALEPIEGIEHMVAHRPDSRLVDLARGPGRVCAALDLGREFSGADLTTHPALWLEHMPGQRAVIQVTTRIGLSRDQHRRLRFVERGSPFVSVPP